MRNSSQYYQRISGSLEQNPGVSVGGRCRLGEKVYLGIGSSLTDNIEIVGGTVIGAGSVVAKSLKKRGVYVGVPVRRRPQ